MNRIRAAAGWVGDAMIPLWQALPAYLCAFAAALACPGGAVAADFFLRDGDRVVILGDSITEGTTYYTQLIQAYALTRHPKWKLTFCNVGLRGDTSFLRRRYPTDEAKMYSADPATQKRMIDVAVETGLRRDVLPCKPTVVTINLGMNDSYAARFEETFPVYIHAMTKMVNVLKEHGARAALLTPQPIEEMGANVDQDRGNQVLKKLADGLHEIAIQTGSGFANQFDPYMAFLMRGHAANPQTPLGYADTGDRIHPGCIGHTIMGWAILKALGADALVSRARIDRKAGTVMAAEACRIEGLTVADGAIRFDRVDDAIPMPMNAKGDPALSRAPVLDDLNRYELAVFGLAAGSYELRIDGETALKASAEQWEKGCNLALTAGPITRQGQEILKLIIEKQGLFDQRWRKTQIIDIPDWAQSVMVRAQQAELAKLDQKIAEVETRIDVLRQPHPHHFELTLTTN